MASLDELTGLINVIQGVKGTKSKRTTQTQLSDDSVQQLIGDILAGPGGVAEIGSSARASGLYDSTTEDLMLGDLYSRAAVRAETARAPTVETMETPGAGLGDIGTVLAGAQVLRSVMGSGGGGAAAAAGGAGLAQRATDALFGGQAAAPIASSVGQAGIGSSGVITGTVPDAASIVGTDLISGGAATGGSAVGGLASRAGGFVGANAVPLGGSLLSGLLGGKDAAKDPKNVALTAAMGAMTMGPVGLVAAPIAALVGGLLKDGGLGIGSELKRTGRKVEKEIKRVGRKIGKIFGW